MMSSSGNSRYNFPLVSVRRRFLSLAVLFSPLKNIVSGSLIVDEDHTAPVTTLVANVLRRRRAEKEFDERIGRHRTHQSGVQGDENIGRRHQSGVQGRKISRSTADFFTDIFRKPVVPVPAAVPPPRPVSSWPFLRKNSTMNISDLSNYTRKRDEQKQMPPPPGRRVPVQVPRGKPGRRGRSSSAQVLQRKSSPRRGRAFDDHDEASRRQQYRSPAENNKGSSPRNNKWRRKRRGSSAFLSTGSGSSFSEQVSSIDGAELQPVPRDHTNAPAGAVEAEPPPTTSSSDDVAAAPTLLASLLSMGRRGATSTRTAGTGENQISPEEQHAERELVSGGTSTSVRLTPNSHMIPHAGEFEQHENSGVAGALLSAFLGLTRFFGWPPRSDATLHPNLGMRDGSQDMPGGPRGIPQDIIDGCPNTPDFCNSPSQQCVMQSIGGQGFMGGGEAFGDTQQCPGAAYCIRCHCIPFKTVGQSCTGDSRVAGASDQCAV